MQPPREPRVGPSAKHQPGSITKNATCNANRQALREREMQRGRGQRGRPQGGPEWSPSAKRRDRQDCTACHVQRGRGQIGRPCENAKCNAERGQIGIPKGIPSGVPMQSASQARLQIMPRATRKGWNRQALRDRGMQRGRRQICSCHGNGEWVPVHNINQAGFQTRPRATRRGSNRQAPREREMQRGRGQ